MKNLLLAFTAAAALLPGLDPVHAQDIRQLTATGNAFCSQARGSNALDCAFATMVDCVRVARPSGDACIPNPDVPTGVSAPRKKK